MVCPFLEHLSNCESMKNSTEQCASPAMEERSHSVLLHALRNMVERAIRCLAVKIEKCKDF